MHLVIVRNILVIFLELDIHFLKTFSQISEKFETSANNPEIGMEYNTLFDYFFNKNVTDFKIKMIKKAIANNRI